MQKQRGMLSMGMMIFLGILATGIVGIVGTVVWNHFNHIAELERVNKEQAEAIVQHEQNELQYKAAIEAEKNRVDSLKQAMFEVEEARDKADAALKKATENLVYVRNVFADHDFEKLAKAKPGLISKRMQRATSNVFSEFEDVANSF